jgi:hypothetical protein
VARVDPAERGQSNPAYRAQAIANFTVLFTGVFKRSRRTRDHGDGRRRYRRAERRPRRSGHRQWDDRVTLESEVLPAERVRDALEKLRKGLRKLEREATWRE